MEEENYYSAGLGPKQINSKAISYIFGTTLIKEQLFPYKFYEKQAAKQTCHHSKTASVTPAVVLGPANIKGLLWDKDSGVMCLSCMAPIHSFLFSGSWYNLQRNITI